jgi:hypothetical protein
MNSTYADVLKLWCAKCGIQYEDLLTTEAELFKQYAGSRLRYAWDYCDWPETVDHYDEPVVNGELHRSDDMAYVFGVFDKDPYANNDAAALRYQLRGDGIVVRGSDLPALAVVVYKKRVPALEELTDEIPKRLAEYVAQGAYSDYLRTERDPRADGEEIRAEGLLMREVDIFERLEQQGRLGVERQVYAPAIQ